MNEDQIECRRATQRRGQVIGYAGENLSSQIGILLIGVPCEVCEHCGVLAFEAKREQLFIITTHFLYSFVPKSLI
jgi:hypothetical protein